MANDLGPLAHIGQFIRHEVIPAGMSVTEAARRLGVGRPALSNLLNGRASLSGDMARRLKEAFGADGRKLLEMQAATAQKERNSNAKPVRAYVPSFLVIKARQIEAWADGNLEARQQLPVLLRRLIHSTGQNLRRVDFSAYDNSERKGADGFVEAGTATPWVPEGMSYWEFGTNQKPAEKAEDDYTARLRSVPADERAQSCFVFVTPRNWPGKLEWEKKKRLARAWKAVRAFDASDLEQWLEESIPGQMWLAEKLAVPVSGFETLDRCWHRWSTASDPPMRPEIFEPSISAYRPAFADWLRKPSERPFIVTADSKDEASAFLACVLADGAISAEAGDLAILFDSAEPLRKLAATTSAFIPIVLSDEAERELAPLYRRFHCVAIRPRNAVDSDADVALDLLGSDTFEKALEAMGIEREHFDRLAEESGRSPTILRRRLSRIPAIRNPKWASDADIARTIVPMAFVGAWHARSHADCEVISILANAPHRVVEENLATLAKFDDPPVWSIGQYHGVASKIDALFAISSVVTRDALLGFLTLAEYVLSETDPALELPEDQRWAAGIYGKVRDHSSVLRKGVCETLVLLAVHGNGLFKERLGLDVETEITGLVRRLLTPLTLDKFLSHDADLPRYAEAAPDGFLTLLETDLRQANPVTLELLKPAGAALFSRCPRTGLLWALECLSWKSESLARVVMILARLSRTRIDDNWANKPIASLSAIFRCWMPQTAASVNERIRLLELLAHKFPDVGWEVCLEQFEPGPRFGDYSYRPRWRSDASGAGQGVTRKESYLFARKALDLSLTWPRHDQTTLGDLVERSEELSVEDALAVWDLIDRWSEATTDDAARADLRERIRRFALTQRGRRRGLETGVMKRSRDAYNRLEPTDLTLRHLWLFAKQWVEESADELQDEELHYTKREERIHQLRLNAMNDIWRALGRDGILAILARSDAPSTVGWYVARCVTTEEAIHFVRDCLVVDGASARNIDGCVQGFLASLDPEPRSQLIKNIADSARSDELGRLLRLAPFGQHTWRLLDQHSDEIALRYWREVRPYWNRHEGAELIELVDRLLEVQRPRAAFNTVHMDWEQLETSRLKRLLLAVAREGSEPSGEYTLDAHEISDALQSLEGRTGISTEEMAQLEFVFIEALDRSKHGIPNLEKQIASSPSLFVQAVGMAYRREDEGVDPPEWHVASAERQASIVRTVNRLLRQLHRMPGTADDGAINAQSLVSWLAEVRRLFTEYGRLQIGDYWLGELLSRAPSDQDGTWPCRAVCEAMEAIASERLADGFYIGVHNSRGTVWRGKGGAQEREHALNYRRWSQQLAVDYPYVGSALERIASSYDREAEWHDSDDKVRKRLRH